MNCSTSKNKSLHSLKDKKNKLTHLLSYDINLFDREENDHIV